jgi:hypothetical protein
MLIDAKHGNVASVGKLSVQALLAHNDPYRGGIRLIGRISLFDVMNGVNA